MPNRWIFVSRYSIYLVAANQDSPVYHALDASVNAATGIASNKTAVQVYRVQNYIT